MSLLSNVNSIRERISIACQSSGRSASEVTIIAATKSIPPARIEEALRLGIADFGENYLQEFFAKRDACPTNVVWHFIGRIQSNKAARIGQHFPWVHTIASADQARRIAAGAQSCPNPVSVLIEVNIASEPQKAGVLPDEVEKLAELVYHLPNVRLRGLMTMGPANRNAEDQRPYFEAMRRLQERLSIEGADCLGMGMSQDFDVAIQEGATHVRIGTALFGPRKSKEGA